jgi:Family of unknown function (DUF6345)
MREYICAIASRGLKAFCVSLYAITTIFLSTHSGNAAQSEASLPVYEVTQTGIRDEHARRLARALSVRPDKLAVRDGVVSYLDPDNYLFVPKVDVSDSDVMQKLRAGVAPDRLGTQVRVQAVDFAALDKLPVLENGAALKKAVEVFSGSRLVSELDKPSVGHAKFVASMTDGSKSVSHELNTWVNYQFFTRNGHALIGPGAQARVTYNGAGRVVQFTYAFRELKEGPSVRIISEEDARKRVAGHLPENARISLELVYWCPSMRRAPGHKEPLRPKFIIPWYSVHSVVPVTDPNTGIVSEVRSKVQLIPATDDPRFVPTAHLKASGRERVQAAVEVSGGSLPYTYVWSASDPLVSEQTGASISYVPIVRAVPRPGSTLPENLTLARRETVAVTVTDANGVTLQESESLTVAAHLVPHGKGGGPSASYGTESPREPTFAIDRVGWQNGMGTPGAGGGAQVFAWLGDLAWPGDFIEPNPPGTLPATPWINGDADYSNWGVNTAAIVLNNTDGWAGGFDSAQPGATLAEYATAYLAVPSSTGVTVVTGLLNGAATASTVNSSINYSGAWTPVGPNDQLLWLVMDACDTLDATSSAGTPSERWGPAFGGLHLMFGFNSEEQVGDGSFEQDFAENLLGVSGAPQQIVIAWFNAAATAGMGHGVPAVLGALGPGGVCDQFDYYLGKGTQGPTILPSAVTGWWYISD